MPDKPATPPTPASTGAATPPAAQGDDLLAEAQKKAPHVDRAFLSKHGLDDDYLRALANGSEPPPPYNGPDDSTTDLHRTDGGWQLTPAGVPPEDVGKDQVGALVIETSVPGARGSDTVGASPAEAVALAMARREALAVDIGPAGNSAGDELPNPYTP